MSQDPIWISHRGLKERATENTLAAFKDAVDHGYSHIETDLRTTTDGQIVLVHDSSLYRLFGLPIMIEDSTEKDLRKISYPNDQGILFFDEFMSNFGKLNLTFDIKPEQGNRTLNALSNWLRKNDPSLKLLSHVRFLFWKPEHQQRWLSEFPQSTCLAREPECMRAGLAMALRLPINSKIVSEKTYALPFCFAGLKIMRPSVVGRYHAKGAKVIAYLPKDENEQRQALKAGVDEILCDGLILKP